MNTHSSNSFRYIPILIFVVPILAINVCYFVAASLEHVAWCIPYLEGCTSISATGRNPPESYIYRASIMPTAVLMGLYWIFNYHWLSVLGDKKTWAKLTILILGISASVFLILYTTMLGAIDDTYQILRRIMVTSYFSSTFLAQLILTSRVWNLKKYHKVMNLGWLPETQVLLCSLMLGLGLLSIPLNAYVTNADNIVE